MGLKCSACGFRSKNRAFFRIEKTSRKGSGWFCLGCKPLPGRLGFVTLGIYGALALAAGLFMAANPGLEPFGYIMALASGFVLLTPLTLVVHEFGHALAAIAVGRRVYRINIGRGATFATLRLGQTLVIIVRDMGAGSVVALPVARNGRLRQAIFFLAGSAANFATGGVLISLVERVTGTDQNIWAGEADCILWGCILSNLLTGVVSLLPGRVTVNSGVLPTDGSLFLGLFKGQQETPDWQVHHDDHLGRALVHTKQWTEAEAHYRRSFAAHLDQPGFLAMLLHVLALAKGPEAATACALEHETYLRSGEPATELYAPIWASTWGNAAWAILRSRDGDPTLADEFSVRAAEADAVSPYPRSVRSAVLIRSGQGSDSLGVILDSLKDMGDAGDKLEFCDFIVAEGLESADLKRADFEAYAAHLRALA